MQPKNKCSMFFSIMHVCQQVDECVPYEKIASQMRILNDEQRIIVDEFYTRKKNSNKTITCIFNKRCMNKKNVYINVHHTKHVTILYNRNYRHRPSKTKSDEINIHKKNNI